MLNGALGVLGNSGIASGDQFLLFIFAITFEANNPGKSREIVSVSRPICRMSRVYLVSAWVPGISHEQLSQAACFTASSISTRLAA